MVIGIIGAGNIGGQVAYLAAPLHKVILYDKLHSIAMGKACDINDAMSVDYNPSNVHATDRLEDFYDADVIVITAGFPRTPVMKRDELLMSNADVMIELGTRLKGFKGFCIIVSNPVDAMVGVFQASACMPHNMVVGMSGVLDSARFRLQIANALGTDIRNISAIVMGNHLDTMVPLIGHCFVNGEPITNLLSKEAINRIVEETTNRGFNILYLNKGVSSHYSPAISVMNILNSFIYNQNRVLSCVAFCTGKFLKYNMYMGIPVAITNNGAKELDAWNFSEEELNLLDKAALAVQQLYNILKVHHKM